jgi:hypothetical protein
MNMAGFEHAIPASDRPLNLGVDLSALNNKVNDNKNASKIGLK